MTEKKKPQMQEDEESDDRFDHLVPVTGGLIHAEVMEDDESNAVRFRIQEMERKVDEHKLELGALFYRVRLNATYTRWASPITGKPYQTWEEYVDTESSFGVRSINQMIAMWWWFSELNAFPQIREAIRRIGWTKARVLVGLVDDTNWDKWFELASRLDRKKLETHARAAMDKAGVPRRPSLGLGRPNPKGVLPDVVDVEPEPEEDSEDPTRMDWKTRDVDKPETTGATPVDEVIKSPEDTVNTRPAAPVGGQADPEPQERAGIAPPSTEDLDAFKSKRVWWRVLVEEGQKEHIENAVRAAYDVVKETRDLTKRPTKDEIGMGLGLEMMATHFLAFYSGSAAVNKDLRSRIYFGDIMKGLETSFGVDVIAIDRKTGKILHGIPDEAFEAIEKRLGVDVIALKKGSNEVVYGWDTAAKIDSMVSEDGDGGEGENP